MKVLTCGIPGLLIIEPAVYSDERGFFMESYSRDRYAEAGLPREFVQDNLSLSARGILRGLRLQHPNAQGKLCCVLEGEVFDVAVDVRVGSPTFGSWEDVTLSSTTSGSSISCPDSRTGSAFSASARPQQLAVRSMGEQLRAHDS